MASDKVPHFKAHTTLARLVVPYTENFQGRKLLQISRFCGYLESFPHEIWGRGVMWRATSEQSASFLRENRIFHQFVKVFSLKSFPLYGKNYSFL